MKFNEQDGFDGLDESTRIYASAANGDDPADEYDGGGSFDDDEEEEEVVVAMTSDDDEDLDRLEDEVDELLQGASRIEAVIVEVPPPSSACEGSGCRRGFEEGAGGEESSGKEGRRKEGAGEEGRSKESGEESGRQEGR